jgi:hypothetical protein
MNTYNVEHICKILLIIRRAACKYRTKQYYLYCIYMAYLYVKSDNTAYLSRYILGMSISKSGIYTIMGSLCKLNLLLKIESDVYKFTPLSIEIIQYIDSELTKCQGV